MADGQLLENVKCLCFEHSHIRLLEILPVICIAAGSSVKVQGIPASRIQLKGCSEIDAGHLVIAAAAGFRSLGNQHFLRILSVHPTKTSPVRFRIPKIRIRTDNPSHAHGNGQIRKIIRRISRNGHRNPGKNILQIAGLQKSFRKLIEKQIFILFNEKRTYLIR